MGTGGISGKAAPWKRKSRQRHLCPGGSPGFAEPAPLEWGKEDGAGKRTRTVDSYLGKVALYQLSYARIFWDLDSPPQGGKRP